MINYHYEIDFKLTDEGKYTDWIGRIIAKEGKLLAQIDYVFCADEYLLGLNRKHLDCNDYTDIIAFDYTVNNLVAADIFISIERLRENSEKFKVTFRSEVLRVMAHGVLHLLGYKDKSKKDIQKMREKENKAIELFHVEH